LNCAAEKIIVSDGKVKGVITEEGDEIATQYVVSNASKITTFMDLIDADQVPGTVINELRQSSIAQSGFVIFMGLDCNPEDIGFTESTNFVIGEPDIDRSYEKMRDLDIDERDTLVASCYDLRDPSFSPEGASQVAVVTLKYGDPWLRIPPRQYVSEKYRVADNMLRVVEMAYPDLRKHIEEFEVATPLTFLRYLGHPRGSIYGFDHLVKSSDLFVPNTPHIQGLFGVGGWFGLCGFQPTLESGVRAARTILKKLRAENY
jgi:phytoene dehydrogenase-like protein